ncbi:MAG: SocA family protein [Leptospiraceae bacterium]|nr:SocA family protein [Nanoarchaeota archaeon]MCP5492922.1 SocA family protein [Leptospiraceae bacterium]
MLNYKKIKNLILYIIVSCQTEKEGITLPKLSKILYFVDFGHFAKNNQSITGIDYLKFKYGPVPRGLRDYIKLLEDEGLLERKTLITEDTEKEVFIAKPKDYLDTSIFSDNEIKTIVKTISGAKKLNSHQLSSETHFHQSWITTKTGYIIDYSKAKSCVFEWIGYFKDMTKKDYIEFKSSRKLFEDSRVNNLVSKIQKL